jgi:methyl-accepting chemotaxis protein
MHSSASTPDSILRRLFSKKPTPAELKSLADARDARARLAALDRVQAIIEFGLDGRILHANDNFLRTVGYTLAEIKGQHHSLFVDPAYRDSQEYRLFWDKLGRGEYEAGEFRRLGKGGKEVWIQASYNAVMDDGGQPYKVVKFATDITALKLRNADYEGQIHSIGKVQAVIEFSLEGRILHANDNFLSAVGYTLVEIKGQHHSIFVEPGYRDSVEYRLFWEKLGRGVYDAGEYKRIGKGGKRSLDSGQLQPHHGHERQTLQSGQIRHGCHGSEIEECRLRGPDRRHRKGTSGHRIQHGRQSAERQ